MKLKARLLLFAPLASSVWFYLRVMRPLRQLAAKSKRMSEGDFTALAHGSDGAAEIHTLRLAMNAMVGHVRRAQAQENTYIQALTNGQETERSRIARELHDDTVQSLIAISQSLEIAQSLMAADSPALPLLQGARLQAVETVNNLRGLIANLRPPILAELGLVPALLMLSERTHEPAVKIETVGIVRRLNESQELALFRGVQEAIWNAQRHGQADQVAVKITYASHEISVLVQDNGRGFVLPENLRELSSSGHYGLVGLAERIDYLGGEVHLASELGSGTQITICLPVGESQQPDDVVRDPVCHALIQPQQAYASLDYHGKRYYFCCPVCRGAFLADPEAYLLDLRQ